MSKPNRQPKRLTYQSAKNFGEEDAIVNKDELVPSDCKEPTEISIEKPPI